MSTRMRSLLDFAPLSGDDWYSALCDAVAYLTALGGGCLFVPKRAFPYDCDVTSPIEIAGDDITIELESGARLRNTSATGFDFFRFAGAAGTRNRVNFRGGRVVSTKTAGHIFTFTDDVGLGFADWTSEIVQLNPARSILKGSAWTSSGLFSNRFGAPQWEHGSVSDSPTVPAVDINTVTNAFNANEFSMLRVNCHHGTAPFFRFINDGPPNGAFYSYNKVAVPTVEQARRFIKVAGALGFVARDVGFYDTQDLDYHLIETAAGAGGRTCEQCHFEDINVVSILGEVSGVVGTSKIVTSLSRSGSTATVEATAHGFGVGQRVYITGANEAEYNGRFLVTSVPNANTFTYRISGTPATPASGTITATEAAMVIKIGSGDTGHTLVGIGGTGTSGAEVDLNHSGARILGDYRRVGYYRAHLLEVNPMVFGAKFDGVTDDTAALQAAIDYAAAQPHPSPVVLPPGQAIVSDTIELGARTTVLGSGAASVLQAKPGVACFNILLVRDSDDVRLRDLVLDGNRAKTSPPADPDNENIGCGFLGRPVDKGQTGLSIQNVIVRNHHRSGIRIIGPNNSDDPYQLNANEVEVIGCQIHCCGSRGVILTRATRARIAANVITSCTQAGIQLVLSRAAVIDGNLIQNTVQRPETTGGHGIAAANSFDYVIVNNVASENERWGIVASGGVGLWPPGHLMSQRYVVANNVCRANAAGGITIDPTLPEDHPNHDEIQDSFATVASNVCVANSGPGIRAGHAGYFAVRGNICDRNEDAGVGIVSSRYAVVADNVLTGNNSYGVGFWAGAGVQDVGHHLLGGNVYDKNKVGEIQISPGHPAIRQLGPGVVVPTDGPPTGRIYPKFVAQWKVAGLSLPSSQWDFSSAAATPTWTPNTEMIRGDYVVNGGNVYRCVTEGTTAASGGPTGTGTSIADGTVVWTYYGTGTGVIRDLISTKDLLIVGTVEPGQFLTGFNQPFIRLTESDSESLQLNSPAYHPGNDAVAVVLDFEVTQSSGTWTIVQLGNGNASVGGGGMLVRVTATGRLELNADGVTVTGATNYEADGAVHRMVVAWDPTANGSAGLWFVATDAEIIVGTPNPGNVLSSSTKGFGAAFDGYFGGAPAWFYGDSAREIMTSSSRAILGVDDTEP